ncbi:hypothetical protein [Halalkalicoccus subterraneus]|uniref:hypothetical protein n=1 Tax=Halalkalicoccus subterraneus TaxID=2675002 RepID=UPI001FE82D1F|nr:hypothetical protein [Halalkalicoccus subterraneus]
MFTSTSEKGGGDPQSVYGEPQHEEVGWSDWESEYYGTDEEREALAFLAEGEFIPGIEYPAEPVSEGGSPNRRRTRPLLLG